MILVVRNSKGESLCSQMVAMLTYAGSVYMCINEFLVSKETVGLRRWERSKQKFGFIKRAKRVFGNSTFINSFDKTKFLFTCA